MTEISKEQFRTPLGAPSAGISVFADALDLVGDSVVIVDESLSIILFNGAAERTFGYEAQEILGKPLSTLLPERLRDGYGTHVSRFVAGSMDSRLIGVHRELTARHKDGSEFPVEIAISKTTTETNVLLAAVVRDLRERQRANEAFQRRAAILQATAQAGGRFLGREWSASDLNKVLAVLGEAMDTSCTHLFQNVRNARGKLLAEQVGEWIAPGGTRQIKTPEYREFFQKIMGFAKWTNLLSQKETIQLSARAFTDGERIALAPWRIHSILIIPLFVFDDWWGILAFVDCWRERRWSMPEIDALRATAQVIEGAVRHRASQRALRQSQGRYRRIFEAAAVSLWTANISALHAAIKKLRKHGIQDLVRYMDEHPEFWRETIGLIRVTDVNNQALRLYEARSRDEFRDGLARLFAPEAGSGVRHAWLAMATGARHFSGGMAHGTLQGRPLKVWIMISALPQPAKYGQVVVTAIDRTRWR